MKITELDELDQDMAYLLDCIRKRHLAGGRQGAKYHQKMAARIDGSRTRISKLRALAGTGGHDGKRVAR